MLIASQAQPDGGAGGCAAGSNQMLLMVIMMAILYFVWIRPAGRERKKQQEMMEQLKRGDEVITNSGMYGTIADMDERSMTLEVAKNVKIKFLRSAIAKRASDVAPAPKAEESDKSKATKS